MHFKESVTLRNMLGKEATIPVMEGSDPEAVACKMTEDSKVPCKVIYKD